MRRRCGACLKMCCDGKNCAGKKESCENYRGFQQESVFKPTFDTQRQSVPRRSWDYYGITKGRYEQLTEYIRSGRYASVARQAAHTANETIAEHILLSVTQNKSYDALRAKWELKEMEQIPYCRTDFYGIRRYFFSIFNEKMKEIGK